MSTSSYILIVKKKEGINTGPWKTANETINRPYSILCGERGTVGMWISGDGQYSLSLIQ